MLQDSVEWALMHQRATLALGTMFHLSGEASGGGAWCAYGIVYCEINLGVPERDVWLALGIMSRLLDES